MERFEVEKANQILTGCLDGQVKEAVGPLGVEDSGWGGIVRKR